MRGALVLLVGLLSGWWGSCVLSGEAVPDHKLVANPRPYPPYPPPGYGSLAKPVLGFKEGIKRADILPGRLIVDPPTLENLGFRWFIEGDSNRNASVLVFYRRDGEHKWKQALPMLRVHNEIAGLPNRQPWRTGNLFAGSVMFLESGTTYEVKLVMKDPDGGAPPPRIITVRTREVPKAYEKGRILEVYPKKRAGAFDSIMSAYESAKPGDVVLIHSGVYRGAYRLTKSGEPGKPIVFRGAGDGKAILEALDIPGKFPDDSPANTRGIFRIDGVDYIFFENLVLRGDGIFSGRKHEKGSKGIVIRNCEIVDVKGWAGISTGSENSTNWYIADNVIKGVETSWYPYKTKGKSTGINLYGQGHIVCYNRVSGFGDCIAIYNFGPPVDDVEKHCVAIDFYNNDLSEAWDDGIETDYGVHNVRVYRNRIRNAHTGLSVQPFYGGPVYLIRNELYGVSYITFKLNCFPSGIEVYNNTVCSATCAGRIGYAQNMHFRNNLFMGGDVKLFLNAIKDERQRERTKGRLAHALWGGTMTPYRSTMDYDGFDRGRDTRIPLFNWQRGRGLMRLRSLDDFRGFSTYEQHGVLVSYEIFRRASPPRLGRSYNPSDFDLRLKEGSEAVDAGCFLPGVTDRYTGKAPDLGCYELGSPLPHYGPRE